MSFRIFVAWQNEHAPETALEGADSISAVTRRRNAYIFLSLRIKPIINSRRPAATLKP